MSSDYGSGSQGSSGHDDGSRVGSGNGSQVSSDPVVDPSDL